MENKLQGEFRLNEESSEVSQETNPVPPHSSRDKMHFFTSVANFPEGIHFEEQKKGEVIELFLRRHFITNMPWILLSVFLAVLPIAFPLLFNDIPFPMPTGIVLTLMLASYYLFIFGFVLLNFTLWYFHTGIVTNLRVIDIDVTSVLIRIVSEAKNEDIQDVTSSQVGFVRSLFNYGEVHIQTSGSLQNIEFDRVPRPTSTARTIADLTHHRKK